MVTACRKNNRTKKIFWPQFYLLLSHRTMTKEIEEETQRKGKKGKGGKGKKRKVSRSNAPYPGDPHVTLPSLTAGTEAEPPLQFKSLTRPVSYHDLLLCFALLGASSFFPVPDESEAARDARAICVRAPAPTSFACFPVFFLGHPAALQPPWPVDYPSKRSDARDGRQIGLVADASLPPAPTSF